MATAAVTYTFTPNTTILSAEANTNFSDLVSFLNNSVMHRDASAAFTAVPSGPSTDPSTDNHLARKKYVDDSITGLYTAPAAYTPSHTGITVGNGTEIARVIYVGKLVFVSYQLTGGSTTSLDIVSAIQVGLPVAVANGPAAGAGEIRDFGGRSYPITAAAAAGATACVLNHPESSLDGRVNGAAPFYPFSTNDLLRFTIVYEKA